MSFDIKNTDIKNAFGGGFIKTTDAPLAALDSQNKVLLNRKGNEFMNAGQVEQAKKIFQATGYSDGLVRVGDYYFKKNQSLKALKFYLLAHNKQKTNILLQNISQVISSIIKE